MRPAEAGRATAGRRQDRPGRRVRRRRRGAAGEKDLAGVGGGFEPWEGGAAGGFVGTGPGGVVVEARGEVEDDEGLSLRGGRGGGGGRIDGCIGGVGTGDGGGGRHARQSGQDDTPRVREELRKWREGAGRGRGEARRPDPGPRAGGNQGGG
jgi:hypothetical protein